VGGAGRRVGVGVRRRRLCAHGQTRRGAG
jgi:hypothetical protein